MKPSVESLHPGAGELAPWIRGLAAVAEDQVKFSAPMTICTFSSRASNALFWSPTAVGTHVVHTYLHEGKTLITENKILNRGKK